MHRFVSKEGSGEWLIIRGDELKHIKALRAKRGDPIEVFFNGKLYRAVLENIERDKAVCKKLEELPQTLPLPHVVLYQCLPIELRLMEEVIDRASQVGAVSLVPVISRRSFKDTKLLEKKLERWERISLSSFKQCKRPMPLKIEKPIRLQDLERREEISLLLDNFSAGKSIKEINLRAKSYGVLVGPEGGFSLEEVKELRDKGWISVFLRPYILRTEMAGAVAVAILMNLAD